MSELGQVEYSNSSSYVAQSLGYDSLNTSPTYSAFALVDSLPGNSTAVLTVAGSDNNFISDNTGFVSLSNISKLAGKRYFKFNIVLQQDTGAGTELTPAAVNTFTGDYSGNVQTNFQFSPACGNFGGPGEFLFDLFLCLFFGIISSGRLRKYKLFRHSSSFPKL